MRVILGVEGLTHLIFIGCFKVAEDGGLDLIRLGSQDAGEPELGNVSWATLLRLRAITAEKGITISVCVLSASRGDKPMVDRDGLATVDHVHIMGYFPGSH